MQNMKKIARRLEAQRELAQWFEYNNPGGFDFSKPPSRKLIETAFPNLDVDQVDYLMRKPSRCFENFEA
jgi:hypothetical protein